METLGCIPNPVFEVSGFLEKGTSEMKPEGWLEIIKITLGY